MLPVLKSAGMKHIFQKHRLKNILGIVIAFQMEHTDSPDGISVKLHRLSGFLFASHSPSLFSAVLSLLQTSSIPIRNSVTVLIKAGSAVHTGFSAVLHTVSRFIVTAILIAGSVLRRNPVTVLIRTDSAVYTSFSAVLHTVSRFIIATILIAGSVLRRNSVTVGIDANSAVGAVGIGTDYISRFSAFLRRFRGFLRLFGHFRFFC